MKKLYLLLMLPLACPAQKYATMLDSFMHAEVAVNQFNGNVLIAKDGKIIYQKAFGYRNYSTRERLDNHSIFELQSITKQFTAMGILQLIEKGKLSLTDSLTKFFPELPYPGITIHHMMTHTSGLPDDQDVMMKSWNHRLIASNKDLIKILASTKPPAYFKPGARWEYSNTAFELLSSIIEKVAGITYEQYINKYILNPLGMHASTAVTNTPMRNIPNYAYGFIYSDSLHKYISPATIPELDFVRFLSGTSGAGNICSTTGDLLKWDRALKNYTLLGKDMQDKMLSPQALMDTTAHRTYGYGEMLGKNEIGDYIMHGGGWPGYHTMLMRYLAEDITIVVLSNNESNATMIAGALAYIVTNRDIAVPYKHSAKLIDASIIDTYAGKYSIPQIPNPTLVELISRNGKLYCHYQQSDNETEMLPESTTRFFNPLNDQQIQFQLDTSGKLQKAFFIYHSMKKELQKVN